ncbi:hypothetical protein F4810DRAFT_703871 [Camillea tinctor]|nr:hypothetical protein F4810DRAFT_703871 [Camillea tinctor]
MNASARLRASFYGPDGPLGPAPQDLRRIRRHTVATDVEAFNQKTALVPVNYAEYIKYCQEMRQPTISESGTSSDKSVFTIDPEPEPTSVREQTWRMFTIFPYRDASWVTAILFVVGSISFVINAFFASLPTLAPETEFPGEVLIGGTATLVSGAVLFTVGGTLGLIASWNADKGEFEPGEKTEEGPTKTYKPALLGSKAWRWAPSGADLRGLLRTIPFQSALIQFSGGMVLSVSIVGGWPGLLSHDNVLAMQILVYTPLSLGGLMFFFANLSMLIWLQDRWYKPKFNSAPWQSAFWSSIGAFNFAVVGFSLFLGDIMSSIVATFIGSFTFLMGSIFQWYDLMAFHPDSWAA